VAEEVRLTARRQSSRHLHNFFALGVSNYAAMGVALVINAILARRLGVEQFGRLALLLTTSQVVALLVSNWTHVAVVRFGAVEFSGTGSVAETFWTRIWIVTPWALAAAVLLLAGGDRLAGYLTVTRAGLLVVWLHFAATLGLATVGAIFQAKQEMYRYGAALFLDKAVMACFLLLLPAAWISTPLVVLSAYAASSALVTLGGLLRLGKTSLTPIAFHSQAYRDMWAFSSPLILSSWAGLFGTSWFDFVILKWYRPLNELGWYSLGTLLAGVLQQISIVFSTLLLPQFSVMVANGEIEKIASLVKRLLPYWFLGTSVLFSVALLAAAWLVPLVFGQQFAPSVAVLAILMVGACALALFNAFSSLVSALGSTWVLTGICIASGAVNVVMDLLLIPSYGVRGAATATVLSYVTAAGLVLAFVQTRLQANVMSLALLGLPVLITCAAFWQLTGAWLYSVATLTAAASVYLLIRKFELFRGDDTAFVRSRIASFLT
jgi:O-antigen/teichoic acid export membrane protein